MLLINVCDDWATTAMTKLNGKIFIIRYDLIKIPTKSIKTRVYF